MAQAESWVVICQSEEDLLGVFHICVSTKDKTLSADDDVDVLHGDLLINGEGAIRELSQKSDAQNRTHKKSTKKSTVKKHSL